MKKIVVSDFMARYLVRLLRAEIVNEKNRMGRNVFVRSDDFRKEIIRECEALLEELKNV